MSTEKYSKHRRNYYRYDLIKFDRPAPATGRVTRSPRPVDPRYTILLFSLTLLPLIKVIFPFWTYFDVGPFERVDIIEEISHEINFFEEPQLPNKIDVLVMINSKIDEARLRNDIRKSWGNSTHYDPEMTSVVFVLARPSTEEESKSLSKEIQKYGDLLVTDLEEGYYSLSLKTYAMVYYKWKRLPKAKCLVKADSDNVLHLFNYELLCEETRAPVIIGNCDVEQRVKRKNSKWAVPYELYEKPYWPRYCSTGTYVFCGKDVPKRIIEAAKTTPFFTSVNYRRLPEDVLFTGLFAEIADLRRKTVPGISFRDQPVYKCRDVKYTYSIHMHRRKDPIYFYRYFSQRALRAGIAEFDNGQIWTGKWLFSETGKITVYQYKPDCFKEPPRVVGFWCGRLHCSEYTNNVTTVYKIRQLTCDQLLPMADKEGRKEWPRLD